MPAPSIPGLVAVGSRILASAWNSGVRACLAWVMRDAPIVRTVASTTQNIPTDTWTAVAVPAVIVDQSGLLEASPTRVYIGRQLGWYLVQGHVAWGSSTAGTFRRSAIAKNGDRLPGSMGQSGTQAIMVTPTTAILVQATDPADYIELWAIHDAGGTIATGVATERASGLTVIYMRTPTTIPA